MAKKIVGQFVGGHTMIVQFSYDEYPKTPIMYSCCGCDFMTTMPEIAHNHVRAKYKQKAN